MADNISTHVRRNLFEIENARNLSRDEMVATFVPTKAFWRLLSAKNHIVLGARGSGKTALAKMLSHDHLSRLDDDRAKKITQAKDFIGIYVPTSIEWVSGLKNKPWQTEKEAEEFFQWKLNISTCLAFLITLRSCLETYYPDLGERAYLEGKLVTAISDSWADDTQNIDTIRALQNHLEDIEHSKQQQLAKARVTGVVNSSSIGTYFETNLFSPLRRAITLTTRFLNLPSTTTWILCLDEAEFLSEMHHRILNSFLRSDSGNIVFKITTMPYSHHTLETNANASLDVGHDFEYVYIDKDPIFLTSAQGDERRSFATTIFNKRMKIFKRQPITLQRLLGTSELLDRKEADFSSKMDFILELLKEHGSENTIQRASRLSSTRNKFSDQISRKIHGALLLRHAVATTKGRGELEIYSGAAMAIRCADGNPRRLIRLFNNLLMEIPTGTSTKFKQFPIIPKKEQNRIFLSISASHLTRVQSEPDYGPQMYKFLQALGTYMYHVLHEIPLTTDQTSSIEIDIKTTDFQWEIIKRCVGLGLLFPNINPNNPDQMPVKEGTFHLAYILAPHFRILPRRGTSQKLSTILHYKRNLQRDNLNQLPFEFSDEAKR